MSERDTTADAVERWLKGVSLEGVDSQNPLVADPKLFFAAVFLKEIFGYRCVPFGRYENILRLKRALEHLPEAAAKITSFEDKSIAKNITLDDMQEAAKKMIDFCGRGFDDATNDKLKSKARPSQDYWREVSDVVYGLASFRVHRPQRGEEHG